MKIGYFAFFNMIFVIKLLKITTKWFFFLTIVLAIVPSVILIVIDTFTPLISAILFYLCLQKNQSAL